MAPTHHNLRDQTRDEPVIKKLKITMKNSPFEWPEKNNSINMADQKKTGYPAHELIMGNSWAISLW